MVESSGSSEPYESIIRDVYEHFNVFVFLEREFKKDGTINRFVSSVGISDGDKIKVIYERNK